MLHPYYLLCFLPLVGNGKCILLGRYFCGHDLVNRFAMDNNEGSSYSYGEYVLDEQGVNILNDILFVFMSFGL